MGNVTGGGTVEVADEVVLVAVVAEIEDEVEAPGSDAGEEGDVTAAAADVTVMEVSAVSLSEQDAASTARATNTTLALPPNTRGVPRG